MKNKIVIEWDDGSVTGGDSPESVIQEISKVQWNRYSTEEMLYVLSDRAWIWSHSAIDPEMPIAEFIKKMEEAGMWKIVNWEVESNES